MALSQEQLRNASIIMFVGRQVGASQRDILIALMAALQESSLRNVNYGDRDSVGLFQQRARGWGTRAQRLDPYQSARMFFTGGYGGAPGLFDKNRKNMTLSQAAQAVQVSAYPGAYAKWQDEAAALLGMSPQKAAGTLGGGKQGGSMGGGGWFRPVRNGTLTQSYGRPNSGYAAGHHTGIDYGVPIGTPVYAAAGGKVVRVTSGGAYGTRIEIEHGGKLWTLYAHLSQATVRVGQTVSPGALIGKSGNSGNSTGPHLHFEVRQGANKYSNTVNPMKYLNGSTTPSGYVDMPQNVTETVPVDTMELLKGTTPLDKVGANLSKPYVYMNPINMMTAPNIPVPEGPINQLADGPLVQSEPPATLEQGANPLDVTPLEPEAI